MTTSYKSLCTATTAAVTTVAAAKNVWQSIVAPLALSYFSTREAFEAGKDKYITDAMLPACTEQERADYNVVLPKKGSEEFAKFCVAQAGYAERHAATQKARTAIQKKLSGYAARIADYAWPVAVEEETETPKDRDAQFLKALAKCIEQGQKLEDASWNHAKVMKHLLDAQTLAAPAALIPAA